MTRIENNMTGLLPMEVEDTTCHGMIKLPKSANKNPAIAKTQMRLMAFPILRKRIKDCKEDIDELESLGIDALRKSDKSIVRFKRPGLRVTEEELHEAQIAQKRARIAADELEVRTVQNALNDICNDPYYIIIELKFFKNMSDEKCADVINCDTSTVRRNRLRLMKAVALHLYGVEALG